MFLCLINQWLKQKAKWQKGIKSNGMHGIFVLLGPQTKIAGVFQQALLLKQMRKI